MILPVILAGGSGERLWPLSRSAYPKQFLTLLGAKHSLFQATLQRLQANSNLLPPLIVCHEDYRFIVAEQLRQINCQHYTILLEPYAKNTAPAIALAAQWAQHNYKDSVMLVLPADHLISNTELFWDTVQQAVPSAQQGNLVTFGIPITKPETGYGYIEVGPQQQVLRFIEKPDVTAAQQYATNPAYLWNSGMFLFTAASFLQELNTYQPQIIAHSSYDVTQCKRDLDFMRPNVAGYAQCPAISIDYAVMEHTTKAKVFAMPSPWSDIGNWQAVWEQGVKDVDNNTCYGDVLNSESSGNLIDARHRLVATLNVHNLAIIETSDAVLIAQKDQSQKLRNIVAELKTRQHPAAFEHRKVVRPWGWYDCLASGPGFQVKLICVQPGKSLSLQLHQHRSEHWVVVKGNAKVLRDTKTFMLAENESTFIPLGVKHQLTNLETTPLELIEVQCGAYLGEDDIVRFADEHGRVTEGSNNV